MIDLVIDKLTQHKYELILFAAITSSMLVFKKKYFSVENLNKSLLNIKLNNKIIVVTGANSGIGYETAKDLANRNATVIMACRDLANSKLACDKIRSYSKNENVHLEQLDLASLQSVKNFVERISEKYDRVDILINNAGVMSCPKEITSDGFEYQFQANYLGHYLLTRLLLEKLIKPPARIINLTSKLYESGSICWSDLNSQNSYSPIKCYKQSKLCNILFTNELQKRVQAGINAYSVSPGVVLTNLGRYSFVNKGLFYKLAAYMFYPLVWFLLKTPKQGAQATLYCALEPDLNPREGYYFRNNKEVELFPNAKDQTESERLWNTSEELVKKYL